MKKMYMLLVAVLIVVITGCGGGGGGDNATPTHNISGTVSGEILSGVTITLSGAGSATTTTNASGNYSFSGIANGSYNVTPSLTGYTFNPVTTVVVVSGASVTNTNFVATASSGSTYSRLLGRVTGAVEAGVLITVSGGTTGTAITSADGSYIISNLARGCYTVTPSLAGYTFTPVNLSITVNGADMAYLIGSFTSVAGTQPATYSISGAVSGATLAGVTINLTGAATASTTTDTNGNFSITGLANGAYTVTPVKASYTFTPSSSAINVSGANITATNFVAAANPATTYSISGAVSGAVLSGVTITLSGAGSATTTTNASGNYSFSGLTNGSYTVTPSLSGYTFTPSSSAINVSGANVTVPDFVATATTALSITTTAFNPSTATVGVVYRALQAVTATGGQTPYSCSASGLPSGMGMNSSSCAIYGTPTVSGTFNVTVTVTDSSSSQKTASKVLSLTVTPINAALVDNGNGTVTDTRSGLMWQKATAPGIYTWQQAFSYCENLSLAGYTDWRLPNFNELLSLVDNSHYNPAIDPLLAPYTVSGNLDFYWSSTSNNIYPCDLDSAWFVDFEDGWSYVGNKYDSNYVRAVR